MHVYQCDMFAQTNLTFLKIHIQLDMPRSLFIPPTVLSIDRINAFNNIIGLNLWYRSIWFKFAVVVGYISKLFTHSTEQSTCIELYKLTHIHTSQR